MTSLWSTDSNRTLSDLPMELLHHTLDHFHQGEMVSLVRELLLDEEVRFRKLLERGRHVISHERFRGPLDQDDFDYLYETHGLPRELIQTLLLEPSR